MIDSYEKYRQVAKYAGGYFEEQFLELIKRLEVAEKERDAAELMSLALRAKIEQIERQEPVAWAATDETCRIVEALGFNQSRRFDTPLYALPGAQGEEK